MAELAATTVLMSFIAIAFGVAYYKLVKAIETTLTRDSIAERGKDDKGTF